MMHYYTKFEVLLFDSGPGSWSVCASTSWDALSLSRELAKGFPLLSLPPSYAYGSLYWKVNDMNRLLKLDISKIEFSIIDLPLGHNQRDVAIVEAGEVSRSDHFPPSCLSEKKKDRSHRRFATSLESPPRPGFCSPTPRPLPPPPICSDDARLPDCGSFHCGARPQRAAVPAALICYPASRLPDELQWTGGAPLLRTISLSQKHLWRAPHREQLHNECIMHELKCSHRSSSQDQESSLIRHGDN
ncbi:hypothetical protein EJB05_11935, partial [Eragrostis curvula]